MATIDLTDSELRDASQAAHSAAERAQLNAEVEVNPRLRATFAADADRYTALEEKFERARRIGATY